MTKWKIYNEDAVEWAKNYQKGKFHALLCDAPYHLTSIVKRFGKKNSAPAKFGTDGVFSRTGAGFMGNTWDGGDLAFRPETWEAFGNVLYPGAFGMAFSASRNWHRMAVAIEDAGFILHPTIFLWAYGQGFPKATNIATNIHKHLDRWTVDIYNEWKEILCQDCVSDVENQYQEPEGNFVVINVSTITERILLQNLSAIIAELNLQEVNPLSNHPLVTVQYSADQIIKRTKSPVNNVEKYSEPQIAFLIGLFAPSLATIYPCENLLSKIKDEEVLKIGLGNLLFSKKTITNVSYVELIDTLKRTILNKSKIFQNLDTKYQTALLSAMIVITTKSTMECLTSSMVNIAKERTPNFSGHRYGLQALKPAVEPIIVFQKPYEGKPLDNIVSTGAGALNIDGGRIPLVTDIELKTRDFDFNAGFWAKDGGKGKRWNGNGTDNPLGRWPANLILEEDAAHALDAQTGTLTSGKMFSTSERSTDGSPNGIYGKFDVDAPLQETIGDSGGASRFFYNVQSKLDESDPVYYCGKVSPKERNVGLGEEFEEKVTTDGRNKPIDNPFLLGETTRKNTHPTLKPIDLCRYLATLLLPPVEYAPRRLFIPFSGVMSEAIGAGQAGWEQIVCVESDKENGYVDIGEQRMKYWMSK